jgi:membrane protease YdiL (CAAX protease family)
MPPQMPFVTVFLLLVMGSVVAGVVEEASFRGYMQRPIEERHGPAIAGLVTSTLFWLAHFTHPGFVRLMPFYVAIGITYGAMACLTKSILPGLVLHAAGDAMGGFMVLAQGRSISTQPIPVPSDTGGGWSLWISSVAVLIAGTATIWAFRSLAQAVRKAPAPVLT